MYQDIICVIFPFDSIFYNIISTLIFMYLLCTMIDLVQTRHMPPSPWFPLPLLGHSMYLSMKMHKDVANLAQRYGPVMSLRLGTLRAVFVNGPETVKEVLVKKSAEFSGRPTYPSFLPLVLQGKGVAFANGLVWKTHRKLLMSSLREKMSDQEGLEERITGNVKILLKSIETYQAKPVSPEKMITLCVANVICGVGFDKHFDGNEEDYEGFINSTQELVKELPFAGVADFFPVPSFLSDFLLSRLIRNVRNQVSIVSRYVCEHEEDFHPTNTPRDLIDGLLQAKLKAMQENKYNLATILSDDYLWMTVRDIFSAGFETITTTLSWALLYLVNHQKYQEAIQTELDKVLSPDQLPSLNNRNDLPLLQAAILETLRLSSILPLSVPHCTVQDTSIMGYHIPKDTVVFVNAWSVHMDPKCWENPKEFNPYRFIDGDGNLMTKMDNFYPFSAGRRICPGESLAKVELFFILGSILHNYKLEHKKGVKFITEEGDVGLTYYPKHYEIVFVKRSNVN